MSALSEFYLNRSASVKALDLLEISHPNFTKTYFIVRNARYGVTVTLETSVVQFFEFRPVQLKGIASNQTLDQMLQVQLGDLGTLLPQELDAIAAATTPTYNGFNIKPNCIHRVYRSDDLTAPIIGPIRLLVTNLPFSSKGAAFQAAAPSINNNKTGENYAIGRFPMLRGFL